MLSADEALHGLYVLVSGDVDTGSSYQYPALRAVNLKNNPTPFLDEDPLFPFPSGILRSHDTGKSKYWYVSFATQINIQC